MEQFNWCFIGNGWIADTVAKQIVKAGHKIVSVYGRSFDKAQAFAQKYGGTAYPTLEEALNAEGVEGAYIATPNDSHGYFMKRCIELGKPVLCEKPFTLSRAEAEEVLTLAKEQGVYVAEAMWTWHNTVSLQVRNWVQSGAIGEVTRVESCYAYPMVKKGDTTSRLVNPALGGGAVLDIGVYPIRYVYELFGLPKYLRCEGLLYNGVDIEERITMKYDGFDANLFVSMRTFRGDWTTIYGTKGKIYIPLTHQADTAILRGEKTELFRRRHGSHYAYTQMFNNVAEEMRLGVNECGLVPHGATLDTMQLLDECLEQMGVEFPEKDT